jgi:hypothetical protein
LARELATIKKRTERFCDVPTLKREFPDFELWRHLSSTEIDELCGGDFKPGAYADSIALRVFGVMSRETLKKDRSKLRRASKAK